VQKALADASARMVAKDSALAELVRKEQNLGKQISAALGTLNNLLALPSDQRDEQTVRATAAAIEKLRADRKIAQQDIKRRFPSYADLIDPKPPSVEEIKNALRPGEALLSYYFGQNASFVWAVPKDGDVAFASVPATAAELEVKVRQLRQALEPQVSMVSEIPPFDVALGYELYTLLLKPVEAAWQPAKSFRRNQWSPGRTAAQSIADRAGADRSGRQAVVRELPQCRVARAQPCRHGGALGFGNRHVAAAAARLAGA
jgi:hypothetical protein